MPDYKMKNLIITTRLVIPSALGTVPHDAMFETKRYIKGANKLKNVI